MSHEIQAIKKAAQLLKTPAGEKTPQWLEETLLTLETCPLEIPEVIVTHTTSILPYLHARIPTDPKKGVIRLHHDTKEGLLDFGCGLAIHLPNEGEPKFRLRYGDLLWLSLTGTLSHKKPEKESDGFAWGTPSADHFNPEDGSPKSGKIAQGATLLEPIPKQILPKSTQDTIQGFIHRVTGEPMKIALLKDPIQKTKSLCILTKNQIGGEFNPTPLLQALHWHSPIHYTWSAIASHENEENLETP